MAIATVNIENQVCSCHIHFDVIIDGDIHPVVIDRNDIQKALSDKDLIKNLIVRNIITYYQKRKAENATKAGIIAEINAREFKY